MKRLDPPVGPEDHARGPENAPFTLVEYGDFQCPYCGAAYPQIRALQQAMGDSLRFVFRNFPLTSLHEHALRAAEFAEAAASVGKFWDMHDMLYEHQQALDDRSLVHYAGQLDLGKALIDSALDGAFEAKVRDDFASGVRSGVNGTPCLFINCERWEGPATADALLAVFRTAAGG